MKGISHFITGVAVASCFPWTVEAAQAGNPLYFVLGGFFGLLPDTLDFKFYRFFYRHDLYLEPDPANPDPQAIAEAIAQGLAMAAGRDPEVRLKLGTLRLGADYWQQYVVHFDAARGEVRVQFGPCVNTGQVPVPGTLPDPPRVGIARVAVPFVQTYESVTTVDIFDGPSFAFRRNAQGRVEIHFLPWHRTWSHSLLVGLALGAAVTALAGWHAGLLVPLAYGAHIVEDQFGHMGSSLFWPLVRRRFPGLKRMHATDALPNFMAVWLCLLLIFWNCDRFAAEHAYHFNALALLLYGAILPLGLFGLAYRLVTRGKHRPATLIDASKEENDAMMG